MKRHARHASGETRSQRKKQSERNEARNDASKQCFHKRCFQKQPESRRRSSSLPQTSNAASTASTPPDNAQLYGLLPVLEALRAGVRR
jgi:hypothetical protein